MAEYARLRADGYRDNPERFATEFVPKLLKKRLFSSPQAFLTTLDRHRAALRRSARFESLTRNTGALVRLFEQAEEDYSDEAEQQEAELETLEAAARAFRPSSPAETQILNELAGWAERAAAQLDSKASRLLQWLEFVVRPNGCWSQERVIIFTEYRDTQKWLHDHLAARGFKEGGRLELLYGAQDTEDLERVKAAWNPRRIENFESQLLAEITRLTQQTDSFIRTPPPASIAGARPSVRPVENPGGRIFEKPQGA